MLDRHDLRSLPLMAAFVAALFLGGCGTKLQAPELGNRIGADTNAGSLFGDEGISLGTNKKGGDDGSALGVNAYLWRASLDTLSFMPLVSADPFGGVIITDWYQFPSAPDERFKATAYILSRSLRADGVRVTVFRQVRDGGRWTDAAVSGQAVSDIENKVLARARELRTQSAAN